MAVESGDRPQWSGGAQGNKVRVLLIDEDPDGLVYNSTLLQSLGCEVWACWSYADGVQDLQEESWDIVVVSQGSPAFEGRCILERASTTGCKIPVFVLAPSLDTHCYLEAMQLGAADYLEEPVSASEMRSILDTYGPVRIPPASSGQP